jgi:DNA-binding response OmpR family regulator
VEDDNKVANMLKQGLQESGYTISLARTAPQAITQVDANAYDLILLDLGLPGVDGIEVLRHVRKNHNSIPVIILTARDGVDDRVKGLDEGADDYLVKPFAFTELLARIKALRRRSRMGEGPTLTLADLRINLLTRSVERAGKALELTPKEFDLLAYLVRAGGQIVSREMLGRDVWKVNSRATPLDNVIDVHVSHLRDKIDRDYEPKLLQTVRGVGFVIKAP